METQRRGKILIVVIAIVMLVGTAIFVKNSLSLNLPQPTKTSDKPEKKSQVIDTSLSAPQDWQTYTNDKSAFSLSVPKDWTWKELLPTPFVATYFFGTDKSKRILSVDRFETTEQANNEVKKDFTAWANENYINMDLGYGDKGCKDGVIQTASTTKGAHPVVIIDCPIRDTESYVIFTKDRNYLIETPLSYKKSNLDLLNKIYSNFEVK